MLGDGNPESIGLVGKSCNYLFNHAYFLKSNGWRYKFTLRSITLDNNADLYGIFESLNDHIQETWPSFPVENPSQVSQFTNDLLQRQKLESFPRLNHHMIVLQASGKQYLTSNVRNGSILFMEMNVYNFRNPIYCEIDHESKLFLCNSMRAFIDIFLALKINQQENFSKVLISAKPFSKFLSILLFGA